MRLRLLTAVLLVVAGLAGCADGEPAPLAPLPPTAPPSGAPMPEAAAPPPPGTPTEPAAFAEFFYEQIERGYAQLDPEPLRALSSPTCVVCTRYALSMQALAERGERIEGYEITVREAEVQETADDGATVRVTYTDTAARHLDATGAVRTEEPGNEEVVVDVVLQRAGEAWVVVQVSAV